MKNRQRYNFNNKDLLYGIWCLYKKKLSCQKGKYNAYDNYKLYTKGKESYLRDIDMTSIISTVHQTKILTDIIMGENQQYLSKFSKYRWIEDQKQHTIHPMKDVVFYKGAKFKQKEQICIDKINETIGHLKTSGITNTDLELINQVCPKLIDKAWQSNIQSSVSVKNNNFLHINQKSEEKKETLLASSKYLNIKEARIEDRYYDEISSFDNPSISFESFRVNEKKQ